MAAAALSHYSKEGASRLLTLAINKDEMLRERLMNRGTAKRSVGSSALYRSVRDNAQ